MSNYRDYYQDNYFYRISPTVKGLMIFYGVVFLAQAFLLYGPVKFDLQKYLGLNPADVIEKLWVWQVVTYNFLHDTNSLFPLLSTLLCLFFFGPDIENYLGPKRFIFFFILSGVFGTLIGLIFYPFYPNFNSLATPRAALYGLLTLYSCLYPYRTVLFMFIIPMQMKILIYIFLAIDAYAFFVSHNLFVLCFLGGAFFGYLFFKFEPKISRFFERIEEKHHQSEQAEEGEVHKRVDDLLEKISREGIGKLTRKERSFLKKASKQFKNDG